MKVSIIIRAYNAEKTIKKAIKSALVQTFPRSGYEIILVDDGSVDNTKGILTEYSNDLKIITQRKKGPVAALNKGISVSKGEYIVALDADDVFEKNLLFEEIKKIESNSRIDFVYCNYWEKYQNRPRKLVRPSSPFEAVLVGTLFRKDRLEVIGSFREDAYFSEYDLFLRTSSLWKSAHVLKPLFTYWRNPDSLTSNFENVINGLAQLKTLHPNKNKYIKKIRSYLILDKIKIRKANVYDSADLFHLRNLKKVRQNFFNTKEVSPVEHKRWFNKKLKDNYCRIYLASVDSKSIGQIRYDLVNGTCEVNISIHPKFSGFGIGTYILKKTCTNALLKFDNLSRFIAHIKLDNIASQKIFAETGFVSQGIVKFKNVNCFEFMKINK